jgi:hypothetical protein
MAASHYNDGFDDELLSRPLAQKIIRAQDDLIEFWCFGKTHRPEERAKYDAARATLDHLVKTCPTVYRAVMRRLKNP